MKNPEIVILCYSHVCSRAGCWLKERPAEPESRAPRSDHTPGRPIEGRPGARRQKPPRRPRREQHHDEPRQTHCRGFLVPGAMPLDRRLAWVMPVPAVLFTDERWFEPGQGYAGYALQAAEVASVPLGISMDALAGDL